MHVMFFEVFADSLAKKFRLPGAASPEDQLKPLIAELFVKIGSDIGLSTDSRTETHLSEHKVRPDMAIYVDKLIAGYIELKAPGLGADAPRLKGKQNKTQWEKLKGLPNLIYTDGREWALYRHGEREGGIIRLDDDPSEVGKAAVKESKVTEISKLIQDFLRWSPTVPHKPSPLAEYLAPLARFLRSEVEAALALDGSNIGSLANEWRSYFFPLATDAEFADAYAQTITYAMLLARLNGAKSLEPQEAAKTLDKGNRLLARTLEILAQPEAVDELRIGFGMIKRSLEALQPHKFLKSRPDLWLYFYEDFLSKYDQKLRQDYGVYYTPREIVELQVRLVSELLDKKFSKKLGFADDGVVFLDPAVGTGTYPVAAIKDGLEKVKARSGEGAIPGRATQMAQNMYGFELLVGPYAVAHLRLTQALESAGAEIPNRLKIYLADTLASPNEVPPGGLTLTHKQLVDEHEAARKVKNEVDVLVCIGNPPYDRQHIDDGDVTTKRKGGWVRFGDQLKGAAKDKKQGIRAIFEDFSDPVSKAGQGVHAKNLYNDYVYFWRWALWRLYEQQSCGGITCFITASSYLSGPAFIGMREVMRRTFDELWIIDLGGDNFGTRKTPNVFNIQTPVAIAIGVRNGIGDPKNPAITKYASIMGVTREAKLSKIKGIDALSTLTWEDCSDEWHSAMLPSSKGNYSKWPLLTELFPWSHSGAQFKRTWPISAHKDVLQERFSKLARTTNSEERKKLFKETRDRKADWKQKNGSQKSISELDSSAETPKIISYAYRSFDRQFAFDDARLGDYLRPELRRAHSDGQLYLTSIPTKVIGKGASLVATGSYPDIDCFCGRGAKDIFPLYRDTKKTRPNITGGLLDILGAHYGLQLSAEDLAGYVYAVMGSQSYSQRFWNELGTPGPRVPITKNSELFVKAAELGKRLIWLHTFTDRFQNRERPVGVPMGTAKCIKGISMEPDKYPEDFEYIEADQHIRLGEGLFGPVPRAIWEFEVSGLNVVRSWLGYRKKVRAGKKSSSLDDICPGSWKPSMTDDLLNLIWVLEETLAMEPDLSPLLDQIVDGDCFIPDELPKPTDAECAPPMPEAEAGDLLKMMENN